MATYFEDAEVQPFWEVVGGWVKWSQSIASQWTEQVYFLVWTFISSYVQWEGDGWAR